MDGLMPKRDIHIGDGTMEKGSVDREKVYPSSSNWDMGRASGICKDKRHYSPALAAHTFTGKGSSLFYPGS